MPEEPYAIALGKADIKRHGSDVTIIATLLMLHRALTVADELEAAGISVEVIDPRSLVPLDVETIATSIAKTNHFVVVSEDVSRAGVAAELVATINDHCFYDLEAPVQRVAAANTPIPFGPAAEHHVIPQVDNIRAAVERVLSA